MSRYNECKETLLTNTEYAKKKNISIAIFLFDDSVRLYTNVKLSDETNELIKLFNKSNAMYGLNQVFDNLSYDQIMMHINESKPRGGTNFLIPFYLLDNIKEFDDDKNEIFFLSDGYNSAKLSKSNLDYLAKYKSRITTMGIGKKENFDHKTLSLISKSNDTVEGMTADIIQQELLSQMAEASDHDIDNWHNVTVTIKSEINNIKVGTLMKAEKITEDEFKVNFESTSANPNLIIDNYDNNFVIKKNKVISNAEMKTDLLIFMVDQSGSMGEEINSNSNIMSGYPLHHGALLLPPPYYPVSLELLLPSPISTQVSTDEVEHVAPVVSESTADLMLADVESETEETEYVKYTITLSNMKYYQRIIYSVIDPSKIKAKIEWDDKDNKHHVMVLHDSSKWIKQDDEYIKKIINIASTVGNYINIAGFTSKDINTGNFRKINNICNANKELFAELVEKPISDFSLSEVLFYNKKNGMKLYYDILTPGERNISELLHHISGSAVRQLSAAATMSVALQRTPSSQPAHDEEHNHNNIQDMSLCTICFSEVREYIFSCGHCYACKDCAEKLLNSTPKNKCAYCKEDVKWIRKLTMTPEQKDDKHYFKCIREECFNIATIVAKCKPINDDDMGYHLTYFEKCFKHVVKSYKRLKKTHICFCGEEITKVKEHVYFN